jgi:hypothetical protein
MSLSGGLSAPFLFSPILSMSNRQAAHTPFYCLAFLGATLLAMGTLGAQNQKLLAECKPVYGIAHCELKNLGR